MQQELCTLMGPVLTLKGVHTPPGALVLQEEGAAILRLQALEDKVMVARRTVVENQSGLCRSRVLVFIALRMRTLFAHLEVHLPQGLRIVIF